MDLRDTAPYEFENNQSAFAYITPYGPRGGVLTKTSDVPLRYEPDLDGQPGAGWIRRALPLGSTRLTVSWDAPDLALRRADGTSEYRLTFRPTPGHRGDVLLLSVQLPPGAAWVGNPPPARVPLDAPFEGRWRFSQPNG